MSSLAVALTVVALGTLGRPLEAGVGYGYKRAEDPLVLGIKRIILHARMGEWKAAREDFQSLDWQFKEFRDDLRIDVEREFEAALESESLAELSREISRVMYFAIAQKFHWNRLERCEKFVPAKSRVDAARFYYEEILSIGARDFDARKRRKVHSEILAEFRSLRSSVGTAGLFGIGARPPDLDEFNKHSASILRALRTVYPHVMRGVKKLESKAESPAAPAADEEDP